MTELAVDSTNEETLKTTIWAILDLFYYLPAVNGPVPEDFKIEVLKGGITNSIYKCLRVNYPPVLVRIYGAKSEAVINRQRERILVNAYSRDGFGTKIYGRFANGSIEGFLEGSCPAPREMITDAALSRLIGAQLAKMHKLEADIPKQASYFTTVEAWLKVAKSKGKYEDAKQQAIFEQINLPRIEELFAGFKAQITAQELKHGGEPNKFIVLSHNDLLSGNVLYDRENQKVNFVDFEYGSYNYRAFDLANHFCECCGFECEWENLPTPEQQRNFIRAYLTEAGIGEVSESEVDELYTEIQPWYPA